MSPIRRLLMDSMFYLPAAGLIAALLAWGLLEGKMNDLDIVGGEVALVNSDPFGVEQGTAISVTVGSKEAIIPLGQVHFEGGPAGQPAYESEREIAPGDYIEVAGEALSPTQIFAYGVRRSSSEHTREVGDDLHPFDLTGLLFFPLTAILIAIGMLVAEGVSTRNWVRMIERLVLGALVTTVISCVALIPSGLVFVLGSQVFDTGNPMETLHSLSGVRLVPFIASRSVAWAIIGVAIGLGMNLVRSTAIQLRNAAIGGALGGALGGLYFDPINRFLGDESMFADASVERAVGLIFVGLSIGVFTALVERLARVAWLNIKTGPLAGKSFVLYRTPTTIGSSPQSAIYLFKDAGIDPTHASIHRVGNRFEVEDMGSRTGTTVGGAPISRMRLVSGDQIVIGDTVLEFEERGKEPAAAGAYQVGVSA